jgi:hypothetical protein
MLIVNQCFVARHCAHVFVSRALLNCFSPSTFRVTKGLRSQNEVPIVGISPYEGREWAQDGVD